ncbi:hypothetical protein PINS_up011954 [Pythium insidiosum]|nr:hypothetical protein PINS_up011954 [Pythium insidiosum]
MFAFALSSVWMATLVFIQAAPTAFANHIMNTTELDNGEFWLLPDADGNVVEWLAVVSFSFCGLGYLGLAGLMLRPHRLLRKPLHRASSLSTRATHLIRSFSLGSITPSALPPPRKELTRRSGLRTWLMACWAKVSRNVLATVTAWTPITKSLARSFSEWEEPPQAEALGELAAAGNLRIVQVINRAVPRLPDELSRCSDLEQLILIYTKIEQIPDWTRNFHRLEYL